MLNSFVVKLMLLLAASEPHGANAEVSLRHDLAEELASRCSTLVAQQCFARTARSVVHNQRGRNRNPVLVRSPR